MSLQSMILIVCCLETEFILISHKKYLKSSSVKPP